MKAEARIREARPEDLESCVDFFVSNVDVEFISHAELMSGRALDAKTWSPRLRDILRKELGPALGQDWTRPLQEGLTSGSKDGLALAEEEGGGLVGLAFYGVVAEGQARYGMLYDLIVAREKRGEAWGPLLLKHVEGRMRAAGLSRLFLESGKDNHGAHRFFEREGFRQVSLVMAKTLDD